MIAQLPQPAIFAHRGASAYAPENTLAAFELAVQQAADAIELDAKLCADGQVVVIHDQTVDRTTDGHGRVAELSLAELKELNAGGRIAGGTIAGGNPAGGRIAGGIQRIPTLAEVFAAVGEQILINVELTNYAAVWDDLPDKVVALVHQFGLAERVLFSSFNPFALRRAHALAPEIPLGLLAFPGPAGGLARSPLGRWVPYQALHPEFNDLSPALIRRQHRAGRKVYTYTVNQAEQMRTLFARGVDGIFTDDAPLAQRIRSEQS